jgi:hypothetical protein
MFFDFFDVITAFTVPVQKQKQRPSGFGFIFGFLRCLNEVMEPLIAHHFIHPPFAFNGLKIGCTD